MRKTGYLPSPADDRDRLVVGNPRALFGSSAASAPASNFALIKHLDFINDQGHTESCVWQAIQTQHYVALGHRKVRDRKRLSVLFGYWFTRSRTQSHRTDLGCVPREAWKVAANLGFCADELWPFREESVNVKPSFDAISGAIDQQWLQGYYAVKGQRYTVPAEICLAIDCGHPVVLGSVIDATFMTWRGSSNDTLGPPAGAPVGHHMMCALAYDEKGLWVVNSWGGDFGSPDPTGRFPAGWCRMGWDWVESSLVSDIWAVDYTENFL